MYESDTHVRLSHGDVEVLPQQLWLPMWPLVHSIIVSGSQGLPTETRPHTEGNDYIAPAVTILGNEIYLHIWHDFSVHYHLQRESPKFWDKLHPFDKSYKSFTQNMFFCLTTFKHRLVVR